jgi:hypothetical protein
MFKNKPVREQASQAENALKNLKDRLSKKESEA